MTELLLLVLSCWHQCIYADMTDCITFCVSAFRRTTLF